MSVLELAKELGNVAEACRQRGMDLISFYEWRRRFPTYGFEGLKDLPPIHKDYATCCLEIRICADQSSWHSHLM